MLIAERLGSRPASFTWQETKIPPYRWGACFLSGARERTWTSTSLRTLRPQRSLSTNSSTRANLPSDYNRYKIANKDWWFLRHIKSPRQTGRFIWRVMRDSTHPRQARNFIFENQFSREDFLANCHWQFSPRPWRSQVRVIKTKNPSSRTWIFCLVGDEGLEPPTLSV